ncbi:DUF6053 domain-containing protein [Lysobacter enzymogenes]|uniref:DUF6053 domain-containing protein n=1 Tax=Lysobacter enzymogenes TaxID=69 RepID=UPI003CCCCD8A
MRLVTGLQPRCAALGCFVATGAESVGPEGPPTTARQPMRLVGGLQPRCAALGCFMAT